MIDSVSFGLYEQSTRIDDESYQKSNMWRSPNFVMDERSENISLPNFEYPQIIKLLKNLQIPHNDETFLRLTRLTDINKRKIIYNASSFEDMQITFEFGISKDSQGWQYISFDHGNAHHKKIFFKKALENPATTHCFSVRSKKESDNIVKGYVYHNIPHVFGYRCCSETRQIKPLDLSKSMHEIEKEDPQTYQHMHVVGNLATSFFDFLLELSYKKALPTEIKDLFPYTKEDLVEFKRSAILHDIGKSEIPNSLLQKSYRMPESSLLFLENSIARKLQDWLLFNLAQHRENPNQIDIQLERNNQLLMSIMMEISKINKTRKLNDNNLNYLDYLKDCNVFSDYKNIQSKHFLNHCYNELCLKTGNLEGWERKIVETHSTLSWKILNLENADNKFVGAALHHIGYNYTGTYPTWDDLMELFYRYNIRLPSTQDVFVGMIVQLADVMSAICEDRPYSKRRSPQIALKIIQSNSGCQFYPQLVNLFTIFFNRAESEIKKILNFA